MARISASDSSSALLVFQLLASLGSFLMGAIGTKTAEGVALGKKLDLAAVEATAGGKEGTVIWAKRAEGRVARTSCSGAGDALPWLDSAGVWTVSTLVTLMFLVLGVWAGRTAVAVLGAAEDGVGLDEATDLDTAAEGAAVLAFSALAGTVGLGEGLALAAVLAMGFTAGFTATFAAALRAGFTGALALGFTAAFAAGLAAGLTRGLAVTTLALAAVVLDLGATADLPRGIALFGVFTSCLLAVSKGSLLTVCPCAADLKPVHVLLKPLL